MNPYLSKSSVLPVLLVLLLLGATPATAQTGQPEWADEVFANFEEWVADYNEEVETEGVALPGDFLLRGERVNFHVEAGGAEAVYSFATDDDLRIVDLRAEPREDATMRVSTTRAFLVRLADDPDPTAALRDGVVNGEVSVQRVFTLFGATVAVGVPEAAVGLVGLVAGAAVAAKVGGGGLVSAPKTLGVRLAAVGRRLLQAFLRALVALWGSLAEIATAITVLEALGVSVKKRVRGLWRVLTAPLVRVRAAFRRRPPDQQPPTEQERQ